MDDDKNGRDGGGTSAASNNADIDATECGPDDDDAAVERLLSPAINLVARAEAKNPHKGSLRDMRKSRRPPALTPHHVKKPPKVYPAYYAQFKASLENRPLSGLIFDEKIQDFKHPTAIQEALQTLESNLYTSLRDLQITEERVAREKRMAHGIGYVPSLNERTGPIEALFGKSVKSWGQHVINLLKLLLVATTRNQTNKIDFASEINAPPDPAVELSPLQSKCDSSHMHICNMHTHIYIYIYIIGLVAERQREVGRHHSILLKAVSQFVLLLLKHLNINHVRNRLSKTMSGVSIVSNIQYIEYMVHSRMKSTEIYFAYW